MKKILLSLMLVSIAFGGFAQQNVNNVPDLKTPVDNGTHYDVSKKQFNPKKTRGPRTYSYISAIDQTEYFGAGLIEARACPIWEDSTILQRFNTGYGAINFTSVSAAFNPSADLYNDASVYAGEEAITVNDSYTLDSVYLTGLYMTPNNLGATPGDKIRISIVTTGNNNTSVWSLGQSANTTVPTYLTGTADTAIRGVTPVGDPVGRVGGDPGLPNRVVWDYNLTNADTSAPSATNAYTWRTWGFAPPSTITVPAGEIAVVTFTFFTGGTWQQNVDSVSFNAGSKNHFRARFWEEVDNTRMLYRCESERSGGDFNNSGLMFSTDFTRYLPSVIIEAINTAGFGFEQLDVDWVATCNTCNPVEVNDLSDLVNDMKIYPNPVEGNEVNVSFSTTDVLNNASINVMDMAGKVVYSEKMNTIQSNSPIQKEINLNGLSSGLYFFNLTSDEGKYIKKLMIK